MKSLSETPESRHFVRCTVKQGTNSHSRNFWHHNGYIQSSTLRVTSANIANCTAPETLFQSFNLYSTKGTMDEVQIVDNSKYNIPSSESHRSSCLLYNITVSSILAQPIPLQTSSSFSGMRLDIAFRLLETIPHVQITAVQLAASHSRCTTQHTQKQSSALQHNANTQWCKIKTLSAWKNRKIHNRVLRTPSLDSMLSWLANSNPI